MNLLLILTFISRSWARNGISTNHRGTWFHNLTKNFPMLRLRHIIREGSASAVGELKRRLHEDLTAIFSFFASSEACGAS